MNSGNLARVAVPTAPAPQPTRLTGSPGGGAPRGVPSRPVAHPASRTKTGMRWTTIIMIAALAALNLYGARYYMLPLGERVRDPMHKLLRSSGTLGQATGVLAFLIFVFLWLYPLRKKFKALAFTGSIGKWLDVHVVAAIGLPLLLTVHAAWRSDGLIGLGFASMLVVCASGVIGRYLYTRIPRARSGAELTREEVVIERNRLIDDIATDVGLDPRVVESALDDDSGRDNSAGVMRIFADLLTNDLRRWRKTRELRHRLRELAQGREVSAASLSHAIKLANREIALTQQVRMLEATQRVFRYWHVAHKPFALTALLAVMVHVIVVVAVGATWFY